MFGALAGGAPASSAGASASARGGGASLRFGGGGLFETPAAQPAAQPGMFGQSAANGISGQPAADAVATATTQVPIDLTEEAVVSTHHIWTTSGPHLDHI